MGFSCAATGSRFITSKVMTSISLAE